MKKDSYENYLGFQILGVSISYIVLMLISFFKDFNTSGINIIFLSMLLFSSIYRIFVDKNYSSKFTKIFTYLIFIGTIILIIGNFESLFS